MKKLMIILAALLIILWAVMLFLIKTGEIAYLPLAAAGIILFLLFSLRRVM